MSDLPAGLAPPPTVLRIVTTLQEAGHETWCVGGAVRDALMGRRNLDWDLATAARPAQVRRLFARTIPVGIEFGTVGVLDEHGHMHEVTTFRRDVQHDGRHAVVEFGASLDEDLARRDFTINAIAYDPLRRRLHDPFGGQHDLTAKLVRAVGIANERLEEDRLRALRALRFASRFGFGIEDGTWQAIVASAPFLSRLSPERVKQEMEKTMDQVTQPAVAFARWREAGVFAALVPALANVSDVALHAIDALPRPGMRTRPQRRALRLAALFSDCSGAQTEAALRALRFSNADVAWIGALIDRWQREGAALTDALQTDLEISDESMRRLAAAVGRLRVSAFVRLAAARWCGASRLGTPAPTARRVRALYRQLGHIAMHNPIDVADLAIDGDDLRQLGIRPGPVYGRLLASLLDDVLVQPAHNTREWLLARVPHIVAAGVGKST